ncbi:MAG: hypothetical protein COB93_02290 [Sneathiella sp.]|nr:MAG: hypothetical protein COB93_02290 [Sneathiella sp.]
MSGFDRFVAGLPAGLQLFSLLKTNPDLLKLLSIILGAAPRLAATITRRPHILDALLDRAFFETSFKMDDFSNGLCATLKLATGFEDSLDRARIFTQEQKFLIGVRLLTGTLKADEAARAYTELAETVVVEIFENAKTVALDTDAAQKEISDSLVRIDALKWSLISGAKGDKSAPKMNKILMSRMSPIQIAEANRLAGEWIIDRQKRL